MNITDLLGQDRILLRQRVENKEEAIDKMVEMAWQSGILQDSQEYRQAVWEREKKESTALEQGICVFHAKSKAVKKLALFVMTLEKGIDCQSMDGSPTDLCFMIAAPEKEDGHVDVLSELMKLLLDGDFREKLRKAQSPEECLDIVQTFQSRQEQTEKNLSREYDILAVTACPTGIAHTYLAAEALKKAAEEMGVRIKVETNGSGKVENILTPEEIRQADGIIVAADRTVPTKRFAGKPVLTVPVSEGIKHPNRLIEEIRGGSIPIMKGNQVKKEPTGEKIKTNSIGHQLYTHLMSGINHMLPFIIGGGILMAIAFLLDDYSINPENFGMNTPVAAFFKTLGGLSFDFMLPILAGYIASSIAGVPGFAAGAVGGFLAKTGNSFTNITGENAVSGGFLAALLAGFVAGYLVLLIEKLAEHLPKSLDGIKPVLVYPLFGVLSIGVFMFAVNPAMAAINNGIVSFLNSMGGSSRVLLGCIVGGMMSIDLGGPFNKAAYLFATASLANGQGDIMAAAMLGGMVPPLVVALATTFFKKKFTPEQRKSGMTNYIMGLCFITEGVIPFAALDPIRVILSCTIGSATAGGLSMFFGCTMPAPHGGIFVFPVAGNPLGYLASMVGGAVVGMIVLGLLRKEVPAE